MENIPTNTTPTNVISDTVLGYFKRLTLTQQQDFIVGFASGALGPKAPNDFETALESLKAQSLCFELKAKLRKVPEFMPMEHLSDSEPAYTFEVVRELLMAVDDACQYIAHLEVQHKFVNCTAEITKCVRSALIEAGMTDMEFIVTAQKNNDEYYSKRVNELRNMSIDEWADFGRYMNELEEQISQAS